MEKTFEELIIAIIDGEGNVSAPDVLTLLKQVREATIKECFKPYFNSHVGFVIWQKYENGIVSIQDNKRIYETLESAYEAVEHYKANINNRGKEYKIYPVTFVRELSPDKIRIDENN